MTRPHHRRVFADPSGERDGIGAAEHGEIGADIAFYAPAVDVEGQLRPRVVAPQHLAHVTVSAQPQQAAALVEQVIDLVDRHPGDPVQVKDDRRVYVVRFWYP